MNVRPIKGKWEAVNDISHGTPVDYKGIGAFADILVSRNYSSNIIVSNNTSSNGFTFNANNGNKEDNAMAEHANGTDIHPYNIAYLPLIAY